VQLREIPAARSDADDPENLSVMPATIGLRFQIRGFGSMLVAQQRRLVFQSCAPAQMRFVWSQPVG
jgi:hypothetical protein